MENKSAEQKLCFCR